MGLFDENDEKSDKRKLGLKRKDSFFKRERKIPTVIFASGKGGVGKSLMSSSVAVKLCMMGKKVGLLDVDTDGPNLHRMLGISGQVLKSNADFVIPIELYDGRLKIISMGTHPCVVGNTPTVWVGEKRREFVAQCINNTDWGDIDVLICDFPPGTGDQVIAIYQECQGITGIVLVSSPALVSTDNCESVIKMANYLKVPLFGIVENMASFQCDNCGTVHHIFGNSGAKALSEKYNVKFYGEIPLFKEYSKSNDTGKPVDNEIITKVAEDILKRID